MRIWEWLTSDPTCRAAFITVVGAAIGLAGNLWLNRKQHRESQLIELRRDVYLSCCELMLKAMHSLMIMSSSSYPADKTLSILSELAGVSAKMHAIAEQRTVSALMQFMSEISAIVMAASAKKIVFEENLREIARLDSEIARLQEHGEQLAKIIVAEKTGETPPGGAEQMPQEVGETLLQLSMRRDKLREHRRALVAHNEKCREFLEKLGAQVPRKVGLHVAEVTLAVRSEMRLAIDVAWYRFQMATNIVKAEMVDDQIAADLKTAVEERDASNTTS